MDCWEKTWLFRVWWDIAFYKCQCNFSYSAATPEDNLQYTHLFSAAERLSSLFSGVKQSVRCCVTSGGHYFLLVVNFFYLFIYFFKSPNGSSVFLCYLSICAHNQNPAAVSALCCFKGLGNNQIHITDQIHEFQQLWWIESSQELPVPPCSVNGFCIRGFFLLLLLVNKGKWTRPVSICFFREFKLFSFGI